jgi:acetyltransferase-like isoleucine patch superfamily enzyme
VDDRKWWIRTGTPQAREVIDRVKIATRLSSELSALGYDEPERIRGAFEKLTGKPVDRSLSLIPPFYADYGLNIAVGRKVHIGYECMFTGYAPTDIGDDVMIANKTNLVSGGHPVPPDQRRDYLTGAPITIERNAWIGTAATVLQGVTIGAGSVVAAGSVVTHDVPPATLVGGVPAEVIRQLEPTETQTPLEVSDV